MDEEEMAWNDASVKAESSAQGAAAAAVASSTTASTASGTGGDGVKISKNQQKKAAKLAKMEALKPLKRQAERIKRRERAHQLKEGYANGTLSAAEVELVETRKAREKDRNAAKRRDTGDDWGGGVVIDLGFDELMADQEISSMASQLSFLYSFNRTATRPFATVLHTSASAESSPRLWPKLIQANCEHWTRSYWWGNGVDLLARRLDPQGVPVDPRITNGDNNCDNNQRSAGPLLPPKLNASHKLVYLSADSEEELETLREDEVYVIGGIVDRNRYKNLCQNKAQTLNIRTARLPIGTYLAELPTRKVLTVNQVFQILAEFVARNDWRAAFEAVIPPRKFVVDYKKQKKAKKDALKGVAAAGDGDCDVDVDVDGDGNRGAVELEPGPNVDSEKST